MLSANYDIHLAVPMCYNAPEAFAEAVRWCEANLGVPVWNRVSGTSHKNLLLGDYLIDAEPEMGGAKDFIGTLIPFGTDAFKTWEEVLAYFARLCGQ